MAVSQLNFIPTYQVPLEKGGHTSKDWYFFWAGLFRGLPPENVTAVALGVSPYEYTAPRGGSIIVSGGTVSLLEFSRDGTTYYNVGAVAGMFRLGATDRFRITYTVPPTTTFVPS